MDDRLTRIGWFARMEAPLHADLIARGRHRRCAAGEWAWGEGDEETGLAAVLSGAMHLYLQAPGGREVLFGMLPAGSVFGQSAVLGGGPRLVTAIAATDAELFVLSDRALRETAAGHPMLWRDLSRLVYGQLRGALQGWAETVGLTPRELMISRLLTIAPDDGGIALPQATLAEMVGASRKAVNGWLKALEARGLVALGYGRIELLNRAGLERLLAG